MTTRQPLSHAVRAAETCGPHDKWPQMVLLAERECTSAGGASIEWTAAKDAQPQCLQSMSLPMREG